MVRHVLAVVVLAGAATSTALAEVQAPFVSETVVNTVEVPVTVLDSATGRAVTDLRPEEFVLREGGVEQRISNFSEVFRFGQARTGEQPEAGYAVVHMVYFLDLYLMASRERDRVLEGLRARYTGADLAGELVSVVSYDGRLRIHLERGQDRDQVLAALDELAQVSSQGFHQVLSFPSGEAQRGVADEDRLRLLERRQRTLEFLSTLEQRLEEVSTALSLTVARLTGGGGQGVVVAFTPGQPAIERGPDFSPTDYLQDAGVPPAARGWNQMALELADLGFTLFVVDPARQRLPEDLAAASAAHTLGGNVRQRGSAVGRGEELPDQLTYDNPAREPSEPLTRWLERSSKELLVTSAGLTGGGVLFDDDVERAVGEVRDLVGHQYSLGFVPDHIGDGRTHFLEVTLPGRPGCTLTHREAYVDQPAATRQAQQLRSRMVFGGTDNPLGVRVEVSGARRRFAIGGPRRYRVALEVRIPYGMLQLVDRGDVHWGKVVIAFLNQGEVGERARLWSYEQPITVASDRYQEAVRSGYFSFKTTLEIEGGEQLINVAVQDLVGGETSIVPQHFSY